MAFKIIFNPLSNNFDYVTDVSSFVEGPTSATDHAIARFDLTTGKLIQNSNVLLDDSGNISGVLKLTVTNIDADSISAHDLWISGITEVNTLYAESISARDLVLSDFLIVTGTISAQNLYLSGSLTVLGPSIQKSISASDIYLSGGIIAQTGTFGNVVYPTINTATMEPTGFVDRVATLSFVGGATRTFTITGAHDIYINGVKYSKTTASIQLANTTGLHFIYYNTSAVLSESVIFPGFSVPFTAFIYWNSSISGGLLSEERHGIVMDNATHEYLHDTRGVVYESGLTGTFTNTTFAITSGSIADEDLDIDIAAQTNCLVLYKNGSADWVWDGPQTAYFKIVTSLQYNNGNALAAVPVNDYIAMWCYATNQVTNPIIFLMGQRTDNTIALARTNNVPANLVLGSLPYAEMKLLYRVIIRRNGTAVTFTEAADYRSTSSLPTNNFIATSHSTLTGLNADDHAQYALLAGRVGGQILIGDTAASGNLILQSTSNATRGYVQINDNLKVTGEISGDSLYISGSIICDTAISASDLYLSGTLVVSGNSFLNAISGSTLTLSSTLNVTGTTTLATTLTGPVKATSGVISAAAIVLSSSEVSGTLIIANGGTNSSTSLNNNRIIISNAGSIVEASAITANRAVISNSAGITVHSTTTSTEIGYVNGCGAKLVGKMVKTYFRPDIGNWLSMAFPMFMPSLTDAVTISSVKVTVDGTGTTPTLKWNIEHRVAATQLSAGTKIWTTDKQTAEATALTEYNTFDSAALAASSVLWFITPASGAVVSGTSIQYITIHVEYSRT